LEEYEFYDFIYNFGLVPAEAFSKPYQLFTHMFLHGSWLHIIGNMWFLWVFGDNVEDRLGKFKYILFYVLCGLGAAAIQSLVSFLTGAAHVPMVGASGAISGVLGAYLYLFPHARILALVPVFFFLTFMELPAVFFIGMWVFIQIINGLITLPFASMGGVAWFAHIGGFFVGYKLVRVFYGRRLYGKV
jgi:membrane associated rhomboid family serine protease